MRVSNKTLLTVTGVLFAIGLTATVVSIRNQPVFAPPAAPAVVTPPTVEKLLELTNVERAKVGAPALKLDDRLSKGAGQKVDELDREGWDSTPHYSDSGFQGIKYSRALMPECSEMSENLAYGITDTSQVIQGWMASKAHHDAMLSTKYDYVGFAFKDGYVAEHFCEIK